MLPSHNAIPAATPSFVTSGTLWVGWGHAALQFCNEVLQTPAGNNILRTRSIETACVLLVRRFCVEFCGSFVVVKQFTLQVSDSTLTNFD